MSPVNEYEPEPEPPAYERIFAKSRASIGASDRMPIRVLILFMVIATCTTLAPIPVNIIGVCALALLALDTALHRR